ncbi:esterase OVCA2-like [Galendromus occidentalis]|uniref:Esterase OVCA2-like n=1 Tax=Galendromus occidentalis TaxID=34638 RepID=A0AAJ6QYK6_9ACAR|nr:esterase OVCA2-like [Galendromus occidentalis]
MAEVRKLKILCLHGYRQDAESFRSKLGSLRKSTKSLAEYVFVTAPLLVNDNERERGWWFSRSDRSFDAQEQSDVSIGLESALELVSNTVEKEGPFDGILGFSQGASFVALVLQLGNKIWGDFDQIRFRFAILFSGFESRNSKHAFGGKIDLPALHVIGKTDKVIPLEQASAFNELFSDVQISEHEGGHFIPSSGNSKRDVIEFMKKFSETA